MPPKNSKEKLIAALEANLPIQYAPGSVIPRIGGIALTDRLSNIKPIGRTYLNLAEQSMVVQKILIPLFMVRAREVSQNGPELSLARKLELPITGLGSSYLQRNTENYILVPLQNSTISGFLQFELLRTKTCEVVLTEL